MIGESRTQEVRRAQLAARGLPDLPPVPVSRPTVRDYVPSLYGDDAVPSSTWAAHAVVEINAGVLKTGNHVCRAEVCHKGRIGQQGFCRMQFWHWVRYTNEKGQPAARRTHGNQLQPRWDGEGFPPVHKAPPNAGTLALEMNHPFHFKLSPSLFLAPRCNHDLGILIRVPAAALSKEKGCLDDEQREALGEMVRGQLESIIDHEFYCTAYATKDAPHIDGLLLTLSDGVSRLNAEIAERLSKGANLWRTWKW
jgi:hypothetical protein